MRSYKELLKVKVSDMTGEEMTMFNRVNASLKDKKDTGIFGTAVRGTRGFFRKIGDGFVENAEMIERQDKKARIVAIKEELGDLQQAFEAEKVSQKQYNLIKAQLEVELDEL